MKSRKSTLREISRYVCRVALIGSAVVMGMVCQSCDDDEGYSVGDLAYDWVTVRTSNHSYSFDADEWGTLYPAAGGVDVLPNDGQRAFLWFNPLSDGYGDFDHAIKPVAIKYFLTKPVEVVTSEEENIEYANHPARIKGMWIGGNHLNVQFEQLLPEKGMKHRVSLIENELLPPADDGFIHLEYRYNTYGDTLSGRLVPGVVCYDLSSLQMSEEVKGLKVHVNDAQKGLQIIEFSLQEDGTSPEGADAADFSMARVR